MNVEILDYQPLPTKTKLACVLVLYEKMVVRCDLVYHVGSQKAWIRMPEIWSSKTFKQKYAFWLTKEDSDEFQKIVLNKLFDKYDLNLEKVAQLHRENAYMRGSCRNV